MAASACHRWSSIFVVISVVVVVVSLTTVVVVVVVSLVCVLVNGLWSIQSVEKLIAAHYICNNSVCVLRK